MLCNGDIQMMRLAGALVLGAGVCAFAGMATAQESPPKDTCTNCGNVEVPGTATKYLELAAPDKNCDSCGNFEIPAEAARA